MINLKPRKDPRITCLAHLALFKGLQTARLREAAALTTSIHVPAGKTLCEQGQVGDAFFIIEDGEVELSNGVRLHEGEFFGEIALTTGARRTATASTTSPTNVLVVSRQEFDQIRRLDTRIGDRLDAAVEARRPRSRQPKP